MTKNNLMFSGNVYICPRYIMHACIEENKKGRGILDTIAIHSVSPIQKELNFQTNKVWGSLINTIVIKLEHGSLERLLCLRLRNPCCKNQTRCSFAFKS